MIKKNTINNNNTSITHYLLDHPEKSREYAWAHDYKMIHNVREIFVRDESAEQTKNDSFYSKMALCFLITN